MMQRAVVSIRQATLAVTACLLAMGWEPNPLDAAIGQDSAGPSKMDAPQAESQKLEAVTTSNPSIPLSELKIQLVPLTREQLERETKDWMDLVQEAAQTVSQSKIDLANRTSDDAAQSQLDGAERTLSERLARFNEVLEELNRKGGDTTAYREYYNRVSSLSLSGANLNRLWSRLVDWLTAPEGGRRWLGILALFLLILFISWVASRIIRRAMVRVLDQIPGLSDLFCKFAAVWIGRLVLIIGALVALAMIGVNVGPMIAALGAGGFILAFALQSTLGNFASGLMILIYRPFDVGDFVDVAGVSGKVNKLSLVSTTLTTPDNQIVVIPNNKVWGDIITNVTGSNIRRVDLVFGVGYDDDLAKVQSILESIVKSHDRVLDDPEPTICVNELGASSVDFVCRPWTKTSDYWTVYWDLMRSVKERFDEERVSIPFPQRDVHIHQAVADNAD